MAGRFVEQLRRSHARPADPLRGTQVLHYRLEPDAGGLHMRLEVAEYAPNGRVEAVVPYRLQPAHLHRPPPFLADTNRDLLGSLSRYDAEWMQAGAGTLFCYEHENGAIVFDAADAADEGTVVLPERGARITFQRDSERERVLLGRLHEALAFCDPQTLPNGDIGLRQSRAWVEVVTQVLPALRREGWRLEIDPGFRQHWVRPNAFEVETHWLDRDWFELALRIELNSEPIALLPLLARLRMQYSVSALTLLDPGSEVSVSLDDGRQLLLPVARVLHWLRVFAELEDGGDVADRLRLPAA